MKQYLIINRLSSIPYRQSSVVCPLHLSRILYKSALFMQNKANFQKSQMNLSACMKIAYENKSNWTLGKNKPNQTQFKPKTNPISKIPKMNVNTSYTREYNNKTASCFEKTKPKQTQSNPICHGVAPDKAVFSFDFVARPVILNASIQQLRRPMEMEQFEQFKARKEKYHVY